MASLDNAHKVHTASSPTLGRLFGAWLLIGIQSFGGGGATLVLIHAAFVEKFGWVNEDEFVRDNAICQLTPGINLLGLAVRIGGRIGQSCGSTAAGVALSLLGLLLPSVTITVGITGAYARVAGHPAVQSALRTVIPATVGLGILTAGNLIRPLMKTSLREGKISAAVTLAILVGAGGVVAAFRPPVFVVLLVAGVVGAIFHLFLAQGRQPEVPGESAS